MSIIRGVLVALAVTLRCPAALAHPPAIVNAAAEKAIGDEVLAFRKAMAAAIAAKDVAKVRSMYARNFTHTHTSGKTDGADTRIISALAGDPVIETAPTLDITVRAPNDWVAIVTGTSPITSSADGKTYAVKWLAVYTRSEQSWILAASQATRSHELKP